MSAGDHEDRTTSRAQPGPSGLDEARRSAAGLALSLRRTLLFGALGTVATVLLVGGDKPGAIPAKFREGIIAGLCVAEAFALLAFAATPARLAQSGFPFAPARGGPNEPYGRVLDRELAAAYVLYGLKCTLELVFLLAALMVASMLVRVSRGVLTLANLGVLLALTATMAPNPGRMERWSRRLAASRIDTIPPPGFLD